MAGLGLRRILVGGDFFCIFVYSVLSVMVLDGGSDDNYAKDKDSNLGDYHNHVLLRILISCVILNKLPFPF